MRTVLVVFASAETLAAFKASFANASLLGEPAYEFPDTQSGRLICCHHFTNEQCAALKAAGATLRLGDLNGPDI